MNQSAIDTLVFIAWLAGAAGFVLGLHQMNSPATARRGNQLSAAGMAVAVLATFLWLLTPGNPIRPGGLQPIALAIIVIGFVVGGGIGLLMARRVAMTAPCQGRRSLRNFSRNRPEATTLNHQQTNRRVFIAHRSLCGPAPGAKHQWQQGGERRDRFDDEPSDQARIRPSFIFIAHGGFFCVWISTGFRHSAFAALSG